MKKILLVAAIAAISSVSSFGAACTSGSTLATLMGGPACTVGAWTLGNFQFGDNGSTNYPAGVGGVIPQNTDIVVNFATVTNGFSVTFSNNTNAAVSPLNFFSAVTNQQAAFETRFSVQSGPSIVSMENTVLGFTKTGTPDVDTAGARVVKTAVIAGNPSTTSGGSGASSNGDKTTSLAIPSSINFMVVDNATITGGNMAGASITIAGYRNTFLQSSGVPEPMTLGMMGAGLMALGLLRRRK